MTPVRTRVLLIDDDKQSYIITKRLLSRVEGAGIDLEWAGTFTDGLAAIRGRMHDAYLVDYRLGARDGIDLLRMAIAEGCRAPIIILTGQGEHAVDVLVTKGGAADYLVKEQLSGAVLERSIRHSIERSRAVEELLKNEAQLRILTQEMPVILWTTDDQLRFTSSWGAGLLGLNLRPNEVVGQTLNQFFQTDDPNHEAILPHRRALERESVSFEIDWKGRTYRAQVNPLRENGGQVVGTVGIALDITDAKRLEYEFDLARRIQEGLLPRQVPTLPGFDVAGVCRPAAATGGDYYDFISMPDGSLAIVIADVMGHGFASALITVETRRLLRTLVQWTCDLGEILSAANRAIAEHPEEDRKFVTLFFACLDPRTRSLTYAAAGHEAYLLEVNGAVRTLESMAFSLGIMEEAEFPCGGPIRLAAGELLLLLTDGFGEAHDRASKPFGNRRVFEIVQAHRDRPSAEIIEAVLREVQSFCHPEVPQDDLTIVVLKVDPEETPAKPGG